MDIVVAIGIVITVVTGIPVILQLRKQPKGLHIIFFTNRHGLFRVQASYPGDSAYTKSKSSWKHFKVKRLG